MKRAMKNFRTYMEAIFTQGAGDNQLDTVTATAVAGAISVLVHNANQFQDQQPIDVWTATGGTYVTPLPFSPSMPRTRPCGLRLLSVCNYVRLWPVRERLSRSSQCGTVWSVSGGGFDEHRNRIWPVRASCPGKLIMPYVSGANQPITPSYARKLTGQMQIALGATAAFELDLQINMGPDQMAAWENTAIQVALTIQNQITGDSSQDMLSTTLLRIHGLSHRQQGYGQHPCQAGAHRRRLPEVLGEGGESADRLPRIRRTDRLPAVRRERWFGASTFFYFWTGCNAFMDNPRAGFLWRHFSIPAGY